MSRTILYKPNKSVSQTLEEKANVRPENIEVKKEVRPVVKVVPEKTLSERSVSIYKWLSIRPFINLNGVCLKVGIDRANFVKGMAKDKELKKEQLDNLEKELNQYGYSCI